MRANRTAMAPAPNERRAAGFASGLAPGLVVALVGAGMVPTPAAAEDAMWSVTMPDVSGLNRDEAEALIAKLAEVNVIASNCPDWSIDDPTWALITGTGDLLAMQLGIDPAAYDETYFGPAFALLDDPTSCARIGPEAAPLIARLNAMGGSAQSRVAEVGDQAGQAQPARKDIEKAAIRPGTEAPVAEIGERPASQ